MKQQLMLMAFVRLNISDVFGTCFVKSIAFNNKMLYNLISKQNLAYNKNRYT